jgi:microcystin-dependent protein
MTSSTKLRNASLRLSARLSLLFLVCFVLVTQMCGQSIVSTRSDTTSAYLAETGLVETVKFQMLCNPPVGAVMAYAGKWDETREIETGWMVCDGRILNAAEYPKLVEAIGESSGKLQIPNLSGRMIIGTGTGIESDTQFTKRALNDHGGEENHKLTIDELPSHGHDVIDPGHDHGNVPTHEGVIGEKGDKRSITSWHLGNQKTFKATTGLSVKKTGNDQAHNNMPPYWALHYLIKVSNTPLKVAKVLPK